MTMPGFTAEASLYQSRLLPRTSTLYEFGSGEQRIEPQMPPWARCYFGCLRSVGKAGEDWSGICAYACGLW